MFCVYRSSPFGLIEKSVVYNYILNRILKRLSKKYCPDYKTELSCTKDKTFSTCHNDLLHRNTESFDKKKLFNISIKVDSL